MLDRLPALRWLRSRADLAGRPRSRVRAVFPWASVLLRGDFCPTFISGERYPPGLGLRAPQLHSEHRPALPLSREPGPWPDHVRMPTCVLGMFAHVFPRSGHC